MSRLQETLWNNDLYKQVATTKLVEASTTANKALKWGFGELISLALFDTRILQTSNPQQFAQGVFFLLIKSHTFVKLVETWLGRRFASVGR